MQAVNNHHVPNEQLQMITDREKAKRAKRQQIVHSALQCFIEKGIAQTGIRDIADHAQISLGNLYNHFAGKDALIAEIAALEAAEFAPLIAELGERLSVEQFIARYLRQISTPEHAILSIEILAAALRQPDLAKPFEANRSAFIKALTRQTNAPTANIELLIDATESLGLRCGLDRRRPSPTELQSLNKMAKTLI